MKKKRKLLPRLKKRRVGRPSTGRSVLHRSFTVSRRILIYCNSFAFRSRFVNDCILMAPAKLFAKYRGMKPLKKEADRLEGGSQKMDVTISIEAIEKLSQLAGRRQSQFVREAIEKAPASVIRNNSV